MSPRTRCRSGGEFTYRFVADQAGTYWYHSHQVSDPQVAGGLLGSLVIVPPKSGIAQQVDVSAVAHTYGGLRTVNGKAEDLRVPAQARAAGPGPGDQHRQRADGDLGRRRRTGCSAIDGTDVHEPDRGDRQGR